MSTSLIDEDSKLGFYLNRFYGGKERGTCYQITQDNGVYIQLTKEQMKELLNRMKEDGWEAE